VEEAKASPVPEAKDLWTDIYYKDTEPASMRGREREEVCFLIPPGAPILNPAHWIDSLLLND